MRCNERVKFRDLLDVARDLGADALATGHYVQRVAGPGGPVLHRAVDRSRDQSYFLFATTPAQLAFLRFPLGGMQKDQVRAHAERLGLAVAAKPDSQDICFVPSGRYAGVIERLRPGAAEPGNIVDEAGRVLGRHKGIIHFTVGQRRGLGIAAQAPLYVLAVDAARREVVVGPQAALLRDRVFTGPLAWIGADEPAPGEARAVVARLRSSHPGAPARLKCAQPTAPPRSLWKRRRPPRHRGRPASSMTATGCSAAAGSPAPARAPRSPPRRTKWRRTWRPPDHPTRMYLDRSASVPYRPAVQPRGTP